MDPLREPRWDNSESRRSTPLPWTPQTMSAEGRTSPETKKGVYVKDVLPLMLATVLIGLAPVKWKPVPRLSFHPLHSTLLWCLVVVGFVIWSTISAILSQLALAREPTTSDRTRFLSYASTILLANVFLIPVSWVEFKLGLDNSNQYETFPKLEERVQWRSSSLVRLISWNFVLVVFALIPVCFGVMCMIEPEWSSAVTLSHFPAYWMALTLHANAPSMTSARFTSIRVNAISMGHLFGKELDAGSLRGADAVRFHRKNWLLLRTLIRSAILVPFSTLGYIVSCVVIGVMALYQAASSVGKGSFSSSVFLALTMLPVYGFLALLCTNAELAARAVTKSYLTPLQQAKYTTMYDKRTLHEDKVFVQQIKQLRKVVTATKLDVSVGGFCLANRQLVGSVLTTTVTYLVVLLQLR